MNVLVSSVESLFLIGPRVRGMILNIDGPFYLKSFPVGDFLLLALALAHLLLQPVKRVAKKENSDVSNGGE